MIEVYQETARRELGASHTVGGGGAIRKREAGRSSLITGLWGARLAKTSENATLLVSPLLSLTLSVITSPRFRHSRLPL